MIRNAMLLIGIVFFMLFSKDLLGDISLLMNVKSGFLVLSGTLICGTLAFSLKVLKSLAYSLMDAYKSEASDPGLLIRQIHHLARVRRALGPRELGARVQQIDNLFLRKGVDLIIDNYDRYEIHNIMEKEIEFYFSSKRTQLNILNTFIRLSPAFGFIGTIIGLINVLNNVNDPSEISKGMAVALLTTFYGLLFANFLFLPMASKFSEFIKREAIILNIVMQGIIDISELRNPMAISHRLESCIETSNLQSSNDREATNHFAHPVWHYLKKRWPTRNQDA